MHTFYFIRHGESLGNQRPDMIGGRSNHLDLSPQGIEQSLELGRQIKNAGLEIKAWYCSPANRALQTAEHIFKSLGHAPELIISDELQELSQGDWEGKDRAKHHTEAVINHINTNNWDFKAPNGESQHDVEDRIYQFIETITQNQASGNYAIVGHGIAIKCFMRKILDSTASMNHKTNIENASITIFKFDKNTWYFEALNLTRLG